MTHKKIAEIAHVSESTVSKALSGSKEISEELSQRIIKIAIENGYFEGKSKRKIENSKRGAISVAIVCPEIISIAYAREITALKNEIELRGGLASVYATDFDNDKMNRIIEMITVRNSADGIILYPSGTLQVTPAVPTVLMSDVDTDKYDTAFSDIDEILYDMVKFLKESGHTRIAYVGETKTESKREAYKKAMEKLRLQYNEEDVYVIEERFENIGYTAAERMINEKNFPTAVICAYDEVAMAVIHKFTQNGIRVPEDISVMGINDIPPSAYSQIPLTTVHIYDDEKGAAAVGLLYDRIYNNTMDIQHIRIRHKLIERKSVKNISKTEA